MKEGLGNMYHYVISNTSIPPNIKYDTFHKCPKAFGILGKRTVLLTNSCIEYQLVSFCGELKLDKIKKIQFLGLLQVHLAPKKWDFGWTDWRLCSQEWISRFWTMLNSNMSFRISAKQNWNYENWKTDKQWLLRSMNCETHFSDREVLALH